MGADDYRDHQLRCVYGCLRAPVHDAAAWGKRSGAIVFAKLSASGGLTSGRGHDTAPPVVHAGSCIHTWKHKRVSKAALSRNQAFDGVLCMSV